jgi:lysophospholipase L1-like esterase
MIAVSAIPAAAGTGYAVGDTIVPTVASNQVAPTLVVLALSGSTVTQLGVVDGGMFGLHPAAGLAQASTSGSGTGCTITLTVKPGVCGFHIGFEQVWNTQTAYSTSALTGVIKLTKDATFNGPNPNFLCPPGDFFETDPIIVDIAANTAVGTRLWSNGFGFHGGRLLSGNDGIALNEYANYSSMTDYSWGGTFPNQVTAYNNSGIQPVAIMGLLDTPKPSFVFIGDSITQGVASASGSPISDAFDSNAHIGWLEKAAANQVAWTNFSAGGDRVVNYLTGNQNLRLNAVQYLRPSHVVDTMAVNDFVAGSSFATFQAQKIAYWNKLRGLGVKEIWITTCTPVTTSTDVWATVGNQTVTAANTAIQAWNSWVRTLSNVTPYGVTKVLDVMAVVESSAASGKWAVGMTGDGTHPTTSAMTAMAAAVTAEFAAATL